MNDKNFTIRKINPDDYLALHRVYLESWLDTYPNEEFNITVEDIKYKYEQKLKPDYILKAKKRISEVGDNELMILLEHLGEVIGLSKSVEGDAYNQLQAIYLLPQYHGQGLGYALWNEAKKIFNPQKDIIVHVASYNEKAIKFYEKIGFKSTGKIFRDEKHKLRNGAIIPELEMIIKAKQY